MSESDSNTRISLRLEREIAEALDEFIPELREETRGAVNDRSEVARYLLLEAIERRKKVREKREPIDDALRALEARKAAQNDSPA